MLHVPDASEGFYFVSGMLHGHVNKVKVNNEP